jgi:hypothetical protein
MHQPCTKPVPTTMYINHQPCTKPVPTICTNTSTSTMHNTTCHNNLSHQSHQPNQIYSPRSITKTTFNHMHNITKITNKIPLAIHHTLHKPNTINPYINNASNPHCNATSNCTNNLLNRSDLIT